MMSREFAKNQPEHFTVASLTLCSADIPLFTYDNLKRFTISRSSFTCAIVRKEFIRRLFAHESLERICVMGNSRVVFSDFGKRWLRATSPTLKIIHFEYISLDRRSLDIFAMAIRQNPLLDCVELFRIKDEDHNYAAFISSMFLLETAALVTNHRISPEEVFVLATTLRRPDCRLEKVTFVDNELRLRDSVLGTKQVAAAIERQEKLQTFWSYSRQYYSTLWPSMPSNA